MLPLVDALLRTFSDEPDCTFTYFVTLLDGVDDTLLAAGLLAVGALADKYVLLT